ncbi:FHA domain-containing protein [Curtobacterium sp. VKM Ac-2922]|uniref:FHA domain-containing protein n=1 Tax=Curtobacterium sp. VKM Ac-2922 TaxID=2929475 RepID=UPI001FB36F6D|nr:FHA domain-containing protein [Curtobacterium sp. VKM Ac-2922]MCJ1713795.1 FHA domain-containing protein [Curtobacterium sp. VKM Ac-2922]
MRDDDDTVIRRASQPTVASTDQTDDTVLRVAPAAAPDPLGDTVIRHAGAVRPPTGRRAAGVPDGPPVLPAQGEPVRERVPSIRVADRRFRLDRPVVIGRRPALPRIVRGPEPVLVTVPSALGQVSSSHVLVHAEGEAVVVQDLRSTNGTVVRPAGAPPYRMAAGASIVALTGTVVEIGDGIAIEILSPHLRATPPVDGFPPPRVAPPTQLTGTPRTTRERS